MKNNLQRNSNQLELDFPPAMTDEEVVKRAEAIIAKFLKKCDNERYNFFDKYCMFDGGLPTHNYYVHCHFEKNIIKAANRMIAKLQTPTLSYDELNRIRLRSYRNSAKEAYAMRYLTGISYIQQEHDYKRDNVRNYKMIGFWYLSCIQSYLFINVPVLVIKKYIQKYGEI